MKVAGYVGNSVNFEVESDGIYLIIDNSHGGPKVKRQDVMNLIEENGIMGIDFMVISEIFKSKETRIVQKISSNTTIASTPEKAVIEVSKDRLTASLKFTPAKNCNIRLSKDEVLKLIEKHSLEKRVDHAKLDEILKPNGHEYGPSYPFAFGFDAVPGIDGYLEYHFDTQKHKINFKEEDDGSVNLKELDIIELAYADQVLVTTVEARPGKEGENVYGKSIAPKLGKPPQKVPFGKNVYKIDDDKTLVSGMDGQLKYGGNKISVFPAYEVNGNVDNAVGNINFNGLVRVTGNVLTDFRVNADGEIAISGVCEGARLISEGDVTIVSGIQGRDKAHITAGGHVRSKFIENARITCEGDIEANYIMHSTVKCNGSLTLAAYAGTLVGGYVQVQNTIKAHIVGSPMSTKTEIYVGHETSIIEGYIEIKKDLDKITLEYKETAKNIETLSKLQEEGKLDMNKRGVLLQEVAKSSELSERITSLKNQIESLMALLNTDKGELIVTGKIHPGVNVIIGNAKLSIREQIEDCTLVNKDGKIDVILN